MPYGIAIRVCDAPLNEFYPGSTVYRLYPSLSTYEHQDNHVVVAYSPFASDHGLPETTVFKCQPSGNTIGRYDEMEALLPAERIIGSFNIEAALANLAGSYVEVQSEELEELRALASEQAKLYAQKEFRYKQEEAESFAQDNWGIFAAQHLTKTGQRQEPLRSRNHFFD